MIRDTYYPSISSYEENGDEHIELIYSKQTPVDIIKDIKLCCNLYSQVRHYARGYMPCMEKYKVLEVNIADNAYVSSIAVGYFLYRGPVMISPYIRKQNGISIELSY